MDPSVPGCPAECSLVSEWLKHLRAGLLFFKKKKRTVECGADSQKVM